MLKKVFILMIAVAFLLVSSLGFAQKAEKKAEKKWYVIQAKNGVCSVRQAAKPTSPLAGPFDVKADAEKAKSEKCPKKKKS